MTTDFEFLTNAHFRQSKEFAENIFVAEGFKILERSLALGYKPRVLLTTEKWLNRLDELDVSGFQLLVRSETEIESITGYQVHRGVLATFERKPVMDLVSLLNRSGIVVALEGLVDLENVGTIFRTAAALGAAGVLVNSSTPDPYYRRVIKSSMGASLTLPWAKYKSNHELIEAKENRNLIGLTLQANRGLSEVIPEGNEVLVFGSEGFGISSEMRSYLDLEVRIPMSSNIDSLNVAAAASIALWHFSRV